MSKTDTTNDAELVRQRSLILAAKISFVNKAEFIKASEMDRELEKVDALLKVRNAQ